MSTTPTTTPTNTGKRSNECPDAPRKRPAVSFSAGPAGIVQFQLGNQIASQALEKISEKVFLLKDELRQAKLENATLNQKYQVLKELAKKACDEMLLLKAELRQAQLENETLTAENQKYRALKNQVKKLQAD